MKRALFASAILMAVAAAPAAAQLPGWSVGASGGVTAPVGDADDAFDVGFGGSVVFTLRPVGSRISYGVDAQYHRMDFAGGGGDLTGLAAFGRINVPVAPMLYLIGGAGAFRSELSFDGGPDFDETDFAVQGGVGLNIGRSLFAEAKLINVFADDSQQFIPITIGFRF